MNSLYFGSDPADTGIQINLETRIRIGFDTIRLLYEKCIKVHQLQYVQEAQLSQRDRAMLMSMNISHSNSFEMKSLSTACASPYYYSIITIQYVSVL